MSRSRRIVIEDNGILDDSQLNNNEIYPNLLLLNNTNKSITSLEDDLIKTSETIYTIESIINNTKTHRNLTSVELKVINKTLEHFYTQINIPKNTATEIHWHMSAYTLTFVLTQTHTRAYTNMYVLTSGDDTITEHDYKCDEEVKQYIIT